MKKILNERYYRCFFTGHRSLGSVDNQEKILEYLKNEIEMLITEYGVDEFISGGALGFDMLGAKAVVLMKQKYPWIMLKLYIPCYNHYEKWKNEEKEKWSRLAKHADKIVYITQERYNNDCMRKRNQAMVDDAHYCLAYCINSRSGTGMTLRMAINKSCDIKNLAEYI